MNDENKNDFIQQSENENNASARPETYSAPVFAQPETAYSATSSGAQGAQDGKKKKKGWTPVKIAALGLCCAIIGGTMGVGGTYLGNRLLSPSEAEKQNVSTILQGVRENSVIDVQHIDTSKELSAAEVYAANVNSTVGIRTSVTTNFWGYQTTSAASGSGFIISADGYILTNYHVIEGLQRHHRQHL